LFNTLDLLHPQQAYIPSYQSRSINSCLEDCMNLQSIPSYFNGSNINSCLEDSMNLQSIPSYLNRTNINSCLEDSINLNYIILSILFFIVVLTIIIKKS